MKATLNIDEALLERARKLAEQTHRTLDAVVEDALRRLATDPPRGESGSGELPVSSAKGWVRSGVDLEAEAKKLLF